MWSSWGDKRRRTKEEDCRGQRLCKYKATPGSALVGMTQVRKLDAIKMFLNVIPANAGIQTVLQERQSMPPKLSGFRLALRLAGMTVNGSSVRRGSILADSQLCPSASLLGLDHRRRWVNATYPTSSLARRSNARI